MGKKKLDDMTEDEKQILLEERKKDTLKHINKLKQILSQEEQRYDEIQCKDKFSMAPIDFLDRYRTKIGIELTKKAIRNFECASTADTYEQWVEFVRYGIVELLNCPGVIAEDEEFEEETRNWHTAFVVGYKQGFEYGVHWWNENETPKFSERVFENALNALFKRFYVIPKDKNYRK